MNPPPNKTGAQLGSILAGMASEALNRTLAGAVGGVKREFSVDGAAAALKALDVCLASAEGDAKAALLDAARDIITKHGG